MDAIFRSAHTLKGNAGAMGFDQMSNLAHAMEDVLDKIRDEELDVTGDVIDDLFVGLDLWEEMLDEVKDSGEPTVDAADEIEMLRSYITDDAETDADVGGDSVQASNSQADPERQPSQSKTAMLRKQSVKSASVTPILTVMPILFDLVAHPTRPMTG